MMTKTKRPASGVRAAKHEGARTGDTPLHPRPEFDRLFDALADADRLRLLERLDRFPSSAGRLAVALGWSRDAAAKQLKLLERADLVRGEPAGRRVDYARMSSALTAALGWSSTLWSRLPREVGLADAELLDLDGQVAIAGALRAAGRRHMLECMCRGGPITQGAAAQDCKLSQSLASRGLKRLVESGLVESRSGLLPRRYVASPAMMAAVVGWLRSAAEVAASAEKDARRIRDARAAYAEAKAVERRTAEALDEGANR